MAATTGTIYLTGSSGRNYAVSVYVPDATGGIVLFNPTGAASSTSPNYFRPEEDVQVRDFLVLAAPTATTLVATNNGAQFSGNSLLYSAHLYSANNRPFVGWKFRAGALVGAINA